MFLQILAVFVSVTGESCLQTGEEGPRNLDPWPKRKRYQLLGIHEVIRDRNGSLGRPSLFSDRLLCRACYFTDTPISRKAGFAQSSVHYEPEGEKRCIVTLLQLSVVQPKYQDATTRYCIQQSMAS